MQVGKWVTFLFGMFCLVAVGGQINSAHLFYMAAIFASLPILSFFVGWYSLQGLSFRREPVAVAWEGEESNVVYHASNPTNIPRYFLTIEENFPKWIEQTNEDAALFNVGAKDNVQIVRNIRYLRRGVYPLENFTIKAIDPLGVFSFWKTAPAASEIVVYPRPSPLLPYDSSGTERLGWQEFTSSSLHGTSVEPDGIRQYAPGDSLRRIHWRQTARNNKLTVIEFEETQSLNLIIALDLQSGIEVGIENDSTLEYGVRLTASLAQQAIHHGTSVRMLCQDDLREDIQAPRAVQTVNTYGQGEEHLMLILDALARVTACSKVSMAETLILKIGNPQPGTSLVIITSNPDSRLADTISNLTSLQVRVSVIYIDPDSFMYSKVSKDSKARQRFFASVAAVKAVPFVLKRNPNGNLNPEAISHDSIRDNSEKQSDVF